MAGSVCLPENSIQEFLLGLLPEEEIARYSLHLGTCADCLAVAQHLSADDWLLQSLALSTSRTVVPSHPEDENLMHRLRAQPGPASHGDDTVVDRQHSLPSVPGYEILEENGRGGMGVVYRARQLWPRRIVALKMLPIDRRPHRLSRFRSEIAAVARFIHPNVISIYEVGEHEGVPYFSMEFAAAGSLADRLSSAPLTPRATAELLQVLARAVHFGHTCGVVHRDLKPSNILLQRVEQNHPMSPDDASIPRLQEESFWKRLVPKIADFGLAKCLDEMGQTQTGDVLGTPAYMAPELTQPGVNQDLRTADVYALGAILYQCLIGRPPYDGAGPLQILELARTQEPAPPRQICPGIPRDLETICLKCLAKLPGRRYVSAGALADDLQSFLEGKPIRARRVGSVERSVKWIRRHPALTTLAAGLLALLIGSFCYEHRLHSALGLAEENARHARQEKERADANYREARLALSRILRETKQHASIGTPNLRDLQRRQSENAVVYYRNLASQVGNSTEVRFDRAWAQRDAALLEIELGRRQEASQNLHAALETFATLTAEFPNEPKYRFGQASTLLALSGIEQPKMEARLREALAIYEDLAKTDPAHDEYQTALAATCHQMGIVLTDKQQLPDAIHFYDRAIVLRLAQLQKYPRDWQARLALAQDRINLCQIYSRLGQKSRSEQLHSEAERELARLLTESPHEPEAELTWAILRINWAYVLREFNQRDLAIEDLNKNETSLTELLRQEPSSALVNQHLFQTYGLRSQLYQEKHAYAAAIADQRKAIAHAPNDQLRRERRFFLALVLAEGNEFGSALEEVDQLVKTMPTEAAQEHWLHLANVCGIVAKKIHDDHNQANHLRKAIEKRSITLAIDCLLGARRATSTAAWPATLVELNSLPGFQLFIKDPRWKELTR